jgi:hypothetical protein
VSSVLGRVGVVVMPSACTGSTDTSNAKLNANS